MTIAVFDKDGVCVSVSDTPLRQRPGGVKVEVPPQTKPNEVWWDGKSVRPTSPVSIDFPEVMNVDDPDFTAPLPADVVAIVNGKRQRETVRINPHEVGVIFVDIRGAENGSHTVEVRSHVEQRKVEYPSFGDQLDALWKGYAALRDGEISPDAENMLERLLEIKNTHPKGSDA